MIYDGDIRILSYDEQFNIVRKINEGDNTKKDDGKRSLSFKLSKYFLQSGLGDIFDMINIGLSMCMVIMYAIDSYYFPTLIPPIKYTELGLNIIFILHMGLNMFISDNKLVFL